MAYVKYVSDIADDNNAVVGMALVKPPIENPYPYQYYRLDQLVTNDMPEDSNPLLQAELERQANSYGDAGFFGVFEKIQDELGNYTYNVTSYGVNKTGEPMQSFLGGVGKRVYDHSYYARGQSALVGRTDEPYYSSILYAGVNWGGYDIHDNTAEDRSFEYYVNHQKGGPWQFVPWFTSIEAAQNYIANGNTDAAINADLFKNKSTALLSVVINFEKANFEIRLADIGTFDTTEQKVVSAVLNITGDNGGSYSKDINIGDYASLSVTDLRDAGINTNDLKNNTFKVSATFKNSDGNGVAVTPIAPAVPQSSSEATLGDNKVLLILRTTGTVAGDRDNDNSSDSDVDPTTLDDIDAFNVLTTTYKITKETLETFGGLLWDLDLTTVGYKHINDNPIENVVSLKMIPFDSGTGSNKRIKLGNVDMGIEAPKAAKLTKSIFGNGLGHEFTIQDPTNLLEYEWLKYGSNAHLSIYLPFFGTVDLASELIGCKMAVNYTVDFINGECTVYLYRLNKVNIEDDTIKRISFKQLVYSATTNIGYEIPLFATNRAAKEQAIIDMADYNKLGAIKSASSLATGTVSALATQNPLSMTSSAMDFMTSEKSRELSMRQAQEIGMSVSQKGAMGGVTSLRQPTTIYYTIEYPNWFEPAEYERKNGRPCMKHVTISELETTDQGFHKMHKSLKVTGINAPEDIKQDIYNILTSGFYF